MKFGTMVLVQRGGNARPGRPGCSRVVRGVLVGARRHERMVRLLDEDPRSTIDCWSRAGDVGWWSASAVKALSDQEQAWDA